MICTHAWMRVCVHPCVHPCVTHVFTWPDVDDRIILHDSVSPMSTIPGKSHVRTCEDLLVGSLLKPQNHASLLPFLHFGTEC